MSVSTHVLDSVLGRPAAGIAVRLETPDIVLAEGVTDADGRCRLTEDAVGAGTYRLVFDTGSWFAAQDRTAFYPEVVLDLRRPRAGRAPPRAPAAVPVRLLDLPRELNAMSFVLGAEPVRQGRGARGRGRPQRARSTRWST